MRVLRHAVPTPGPLPLLLCALLTCACGQASGHVLGGEDERPGDPSQWRVGICGDGSAHLEMIDDMEDGDVHIIEVAGRGASDGWFAFNDKTPLTDEHPAGFQVPRMGMARVFWSKLDSPRRSSQFAVRTFGSGFITWGAGIGFDFVAGKSHDVSRYAGVAFWARTGVDSDPNLRVRTNVSDRNTSRLAGVCDVDCPASVNESEFEDGVCDDNRGPCYDDFGVDLGDALNGDWEFFHYSWSELKPVNWSEKNLSSLVTQAMYGVRFQMAPGQRFDLLIDDVSFLCTR